VVSMFVCGVCVCLTASISPDLHVQPSSIFVCMLSMAVAQCSFNGVMMRYVIPVLWTTSRLHITARKSDAKKCILKVTRKEAARI